MCELLGLNFNRDVHCSLSFRGFRHGGDNNPHGWGVARFSGNACQVFKEPINANHSRLAEFLRDYDQFTSKIFIGHVRYRSVGEASLENTHPFVRVFRRREVALAHNSTLMGDLPRNGLRFRPVGDTDSEWLLCALLVGFAARSRGRSLILWLVLAIVVTPIVAALVLAVELVAYPVYIATLAAGPAAAVQSASILAGEFGQGDTVRVDAEAGELKFAKA